MTAQFRTFYTVYGTDFQIDARNYVRVVTEDGAVVFEAGPYRPSRGAASDGAMVEDIAAFALAYVKRPEEFGRSPDDYEQVHAEWWRTNAHDFDSL